MELLRRICCDRRMLGIGGAAALAALVLFPNALAAAVPLLVLAACPLSCVVMAVLMGKGMGMGGQHAAPMATESPKRVETEGPKVG